MNKKKNILGKIYLSIETANEVKDELYDNFLPLTQVVKTRMYFRTFNLNILFL